MGLVLLPVSAALGGPVDRFFPGKSGCYVRNYTSDHLADHPDQRVMGMALIADATIADPMIGLSVGIDLRSVPGGFFEAFAYCEPVGEDRLSCGLEGDAGSFTIAPAKGGAILVEVGKYGMSLENIQGFATLDSHKGDDRSFILQPANCL